MEFDTDLQRNLKELGDGDDKVSNSMALILILATIYLFGFVYLVYSRFISDINDDLIYLANIKQEESGSPLTYCVLNSMSILILCFISMFKSKSDLGVSTLIGSDMWNICILYSIIVFKIILKKKKNILEGRYLDAWIFFRDILMYLIGLGTLTLFLYLEDIAWWMALILVVYGGCFFMIVSKNESLKNKIYRMVGLTHEDDSFNADEQTKQKKKSVQIEMLLKNGFVQKNADDLKKRIAKNEGLIIMKHGNKEDRRAVILMKWHSTVYTIMFAIRNKHKWEKEQRSRYYAEKWRDKDDEYDNDERYKMSSGYNTQYNQQQQDEIQEVDEYQRLNNQNNPNNQNRNIQANTYYPFEESDRPQDQLDNNNRQQNSNNNMDKSSSNNEDNDEDSEDEIEEVTLKFPTSTSGRISYIIFFPFHLILFLIPNYHQKATLMKLLRSYIICIILLGGTLFLIDWWVYEIAIALDIPIQLLGTIGVSLGLSLPYMVYNMKIAKKEEENVEFFQSFVEVGIYKIGICVGLPMIFNCLINLEGNINWVSADSLKHICASYTIMVLIIIVFVLCNKFRVNNHFGGFLTVCGVILFALSAVISILKP